MRTAVRGAIREAVAIVINSIDRFDIGAMIDAIATRAAKQLTALVLCWSDEDRSTLDWLRGRMTDDLLGPHGDHSTRDFQMLAAARALISRLLGAP